MEQYGFYNASADIDEDKTPDTGGGGGASLSDFESFTMSNLISAFGNSGANLSWQSIIQGSCNGINPMVCVSQEQYDVLVSDYTSYVSTNSGSNNETNTAMASIISYGSSTTVDDQTTGAVDEGHTTDTSGGVGEGLINEPNDPSTGGTGETPTYDTIMTLLEEYMALVDETQGFLEAETATVNSLQAQLDSTSTADAATISGLEADINTANNTISGLNTQLAELQEDSNILAALESAIIDIEDGNFTCNTAILSSQLCENLNAINSSAESAENIPALEAEISANAQTIADLEAQVSSLQTEGATDDTTISNLEAEISGLVEDDNVYQSDVDAVQEDLDAALLLQATLQSDLDTALLAEQTALTANDELDAQLTAVEAQLSDAQNELAQFGNLSTLLEVEINSLESWLSTNYGYTPTEDENFSGFHGKTKLSKQLARGVKARKAYMNFSGNNDVEDIDNDAPTIGFNANGSDNAPNGLLKLGLFIGAIWLGSKLLKK